MSKSKAELSITKRLLLDFIKYKTNNNHIFFMGNDKIAAALGLTVNSAKVMVNELIREGYPFIKFFFDWDRYIRFHFLTVGISCLIRYRCLKVMMKWLSVRHFRYPVLSVLIKVNSKRYKRQTYMRISYFLGIVINF